VELVDPLNEAAAATLSSAAGTAAVLSLSLPLPVPVSCCTRIWIPILVLPRHMGESVRRQRRPAASRKRICLNKISAALAQEYIADAPSSMGA